MRLGFFGGSFDPPHVGHLAAARRAADAFALDVVLLAPVASQPLKPSGPVASFQDRLEMVRLVCTADPRLQASEIDAPLATGQPNYTVDTLARLRARVSPDAQIFSIIGADAFAGFRQWRSPEALLEAAEWILLARPGTSPEALLHNLNFSAAEASRVHLIPDLNEPASATEIRKRLAAGDACEEWLTPDVRNYIRQHRLYGT